MAKSRIMVVEDEGVVALQIKEALTNLGYEVAAVAMTGDEAVSKFQETEPDLVLMDVRLRGGVSGIEAAKRIRTRLDVPVVYLTAYADDETLHQAQLTEPYAYVLKPFDEKSLHAVIQMALLKSRRARSALETNWWTTAIASSMMEAVVICDPKGYIKFVNRAAEALLGKTSFEVLEHRLAETVTLQDSVTRSPLTFPVTEPLLEGRSTLKGNCRLLVGERDVPVEFSASPLKSPEGTQFGVMYVFRETGEREKIQNLVLRELEELAKVQKKVLPSGDTEIQGVSFRWLFYSTPIGGGDGLGFYPLDPGHIGFHALDVIGHGILSALFSLLVHSYLSPRSDRGGILVESIREKPGHRIIPPEEVVKALDRRFYLRDEANPYFTFVYGVMDTATGVLRLVRAGHPYPILHTAMGQQRALRPDGYAIGLFPGTAIKAEELTLGHGDRLYLYSDGLLDLESPKGERFGPQRLAELIAMQRKKTLEDAIQSIQEGVLSWRGDSALADDVSLLALERS
ncbi:MAG TPA: SpoIIE family protein phosphatase [Spirochaetia bacterium]|nr:SpoIIE family protein phosphatase [Spirochaetia bacterium]